MDTSNHATRRQRRFNGAMTFQPWIQEITASSTLQWSHDLSAMDTRPLPLLAIRSVLQWSHDLSAMDTVMVCSKELHDPSFNGAMTFQPWIRLNLCGPGVGQHVASMEP